MEIQQNAKLHNRWDVEVRDAKTGEVKQTAVGYNVILNNFFKIRLNDEYPYYSATSVIDHIAVGTGSGTPAITDTALFNQTFHRQSTLLEEVYSYPTSYIVMQIIINADEYNDRTFTEVGLYHYSSNHPDLLCTHAMLQDSEGNPIAIQKTDTDVVYIRATFYCTFTQSGWGNNGVYPRPAKNNLVKWLLKGTDNLWVLSSNADISYSDDLNTDYVMSKQYHIYNGTGNLTTMRYTLPEITILDSEWSPHTVKNIGIGGFGAFKFPDASVFPDYQVTRLTLGEGDGTTTEFNIGCPLIKTGSVHIFVGDVEKTEGTDYTVDLESNCNDSRENYWTAGMNCEMSNVQFGDLSERSAYSSNIADPLYWGKYKYGQNLYAAYPHVTAAKPIWIDFETAKECNVLRLDYNTLSDNYLNNFRIEYSNDNTSWTAVTATRTVTGTYSGISYYKWSWTSVTARYWRVYINGINWEYKMRLQGENMGPREASTIYDQVCTSFFLGRTKPGLVFTTPPAAGQTVEASYLLNVPYKTANNLMRIAVTVQLQRG